MAKRSQTAPAFQPSDNALAGSIDRLAAEIGLLREVIDSLREDFSWVTRNGLPIQLIEQSLKKPKATDRAAMPPEENVHQESVDGIVAALESVAQEQLEVVLTALDGIQQQILAVMEKQLSHRKKGANTTDLRPTRDDTPDTKEQSESRPAANSPQSGRLF